MKHKNLQAIKDDRLTRAALGSLTIKPKFEEINSSLSRRTHGYSNIEDFCLEMMGCLLA